MSSWSLSIFLITLMFHCINSDTHACIPTTSCSCNPQISGESCILNCNEGTCKDETVTCRNDDDCIINCDGNNNCKGTTIQCCSGADCTINCGSGNFVCDFTVITNNANNYQCQGSTCPTIPAPYTSSPSPSPSLIPTTSAPSNIPTGFPSEILTTIQPSSRPSNVPTVYPTNNPTKTSSTKHPSLFPTQTPSLNPTDIPSLNPSIYQTKTPSFNPTVTPSSHPADIPSLTPTIYPTKDPTLNPSFNPTNTPSSNPSIPPSNNPSIPPTKTTSNNPTTTSKNPTNSPTTQKPTSYPTKIPTISPTKQPTLYPNTNNPTLSPILIPSRIPTKSPSNTPTSSSNNPTTVPTTQSTETTDYPTNHPIEYTTYIPTISPSLHPTIGRINKENENKISMGNIIDITLIGLSVFVIVLCGYCLIILKTKHKQKRRNKICQEMDKIVAPKRNNTESASLDTVEMNKFVMIKSNLKDQIQINSHSVFSAIQPQIKKTTYSNIEPGIDMVTFNELNQINDIKQNDLSQKTVDVLPMTTTQNALPVDLILNERVNKGNMLKPLYIHNNAASQSEYNLEGAVDLILNDDAESESEGQGNVIINDGDDTLCALPTKGHDEIK